MHKRVTCGVTCTVFQSRSYSKWVNKILLPTQHKIDRFGSIVGPMKVNNANSLLLFSMKSKFAHSNVFTQAFYHYCLSCHNYMYTGDGELRLQLESLTCDSLVLNWDLTWAWWLAICDLLKICSSGDFIHICKSIHCFYASSSTDVEPCSFVTIPWMVGWHKAFSNLIF